MSNLLGNNTNKQRIYERFQRHFKGVKLEISDVPEDLYSRGELEFDAIFDDAGVLHREIDEAPISISVEQDAEIDTAFDDALALREEYGAGENLGYNQVDLLAMMAVADSATFIVMGARAQLATGENFYD